MKHFPGMLGMAMLLGAMASAEAQTNHYNPLAVDLQFHPAHVDVTMHDKARNRDIPLRIYLPTNTTAEPVVLFSHGLGGTREGDVFFGEHLAARGYVGVFLQHPGSDDTVWRDEPVMKRMRAMQEAASLENLELRVKDVSFVLDQLGQWNGQKTNRFAGRFDMEKVAMSGHSFGAVTTEAVSGETLMGSQKFIDPRIKAAIAFSPSAPEVGSADKAFGSVKIPWMLMTGTKDESPIRNLGVDMRLAVYPALHGAPKYEVVLNNAEHSAFTDRALPGDHEPRNPNHHRVILALSTAFLDGYLKGDQAALEWLDGAGPRSVMEKDDQWRLTAH